MVQDRLELVGTTIAQKYAIEAVVGEGGFAIVYRANHLIWKRPVAIKAFRAMGDIDEAGRERLVDAFLQEGALLAELSERTAAICQARDVGTLTTARGDWVPYLVLEWLEGATLEAVLEAERGRGMPPRTIAEAVRLLEPAAEALAIAHKRGIAHRDIKPSNVFLIGDPRGDVTVKLLDFGIAKVVQDAQSLAGGFRSTTGAVTSFTPAYGAPEQFSRGYGATGPWTDVFALALLLGEVASGRSALQGLSYADVSYASSNPGARPTPRGLGLAVPDAVEAVFLRALAVRTEDRYPNVSEFWNDLRAALSLQPIQFPHTVPGVTPPGVERSLVTGSPPTGQPPVAPAARARGGPWIAIALALAGVVALALGGIVLVRRPRADRAGPPALASSAPVASALLAAAPPPDCPAGMLRIPGGKFFMGSDDKEDLDFERPAHQVTLDPFCIDRYEVTTDAYKACSDNGECKRAGTTNEWAGIKPNERRVFDPLCNARDLEGRGRHPINCVTWAMADGFCRSQGGARLPTEAEWEFAARGPDGRKYPWGDELPSAALLNACGTECVAWGKKNKIEEGAMYQADDGYANTAPVGTFPGGKSRYGVEDVVGNVWEWVQDWHAPYTAEVSTNPSGPATGTERVIRGGAWNGAFAAWVRPTFRYHDDPEKRSYGIGFRCAKTIAP